MAQHGSIWFMYVGLCQRYHVWRGKRGNGRCGGKEDEKVGGVCIPPPPGTESIGGETNKATGGGEWRPRRGHMCCD